MRDCRADPPERTTRCLESGMSARSVDARTAHGQEMVLKAEDKPLRRTSCLQEPEESGDQQRGQELHTADGQAQDTRGQEWEAEEPEESADQGGLGPSGARTFPLLLVDRGQDAPEGGNGGGIRGRVSVGFGERWEEGNGAGPHSW